MLAYLIKELSWIHYFCCWHCINLFGVGKMQTRFYNRFPKPMDVYSLYDKLMYSNRIQKHIDECLNELED